MNILGFTITRTSKAKQEAEDLKVFKNCVIRLNELCKSFSESLNRITFTVNTFKAISEFGESLMSLVDIYVASPFAMPAKAFDMVTLNEQSRQEIVNILTGMNKKNEWDGSKAIMERYMYLNPDIDCSEENAKMEWLKQQIIEDMSSSIRKLKVKLNAIQFCIRYDLTRIGCDVDILRDYHNAKKFKKLPKTMFSISFKYLSRQEIDMQRRKNNDNS